MRRLCFPFIGDSFGGSHISSLLLMRQLLDEGYEVSVALHQSDILAQECDKVGIDCCTLDLSVALGKDSTFIAPIRDFMSTFLRSGGSWGESDQRSSTRTT